MGEETPQPGNPPEPKAPAGADPVLHGQQPPRHHGHELPIHFGFVDKLKRRNVGRVAVLYVVMGYLALEVFEMFFRLLDMPPWAGRAVLLLLVLGFPVALIFAWIYEVTPEGIKLSKEVHPEHSILHLTGRRLDRVIIAVLAIALCYFILDKFWLSKRPARAMEAVAAGGATTIPAAQTAAVATPVAFNPPPHSIAVLPFVNLSGDKDQEYFSDGLSGELLNALSRVDELQVAAQTSSFSFKGKDVKMATIARELNVAAILEGTVQRSASMVRIRCQLSNAVTGYELWSQSYDRSLGDMLKIETDIANQVAEALKVKLLADVSAKVELGGTANSEAMDAYLRGIEERRINTDYPAVKKSIASFGEAIRLDPAFAVAYAHRSDVELTYGAYCGCVPVAESRKYYQAARRDAESALKAAPNLGEAHWALAQVLETAELNFAEASAEYERAVQLAPGNAQILGATAVFDVYMGNLERAAASARRAALLDPLNFHRWRLLANVARYAGRYEESLDYSHKALALEPHDAVSITTICNAYFNMGQLERARQVCEQQLDNWENQQLLAVIYHRLGRQDDAQKMYDTLHHDSGDGAAYQFAAIYAQWGDTAKALKWLEKAWKLRDPGLEQLKMDPLMEPLRSEPRYQAIIKALKFPE